MGWYRPDSEFPIPAVRAHEFARVVVAAIPVARGLRDEALEGKLARAALRACEPDARPAKVRVECRDRLGREPWCAWEARCADGSVSGSSGAAGTYDGPG